MQVDRCAVSPAKKPRDAAVDVGVGVGIGVGIGIHAVLCNVEAHGRGDGGTTTT